MKRKTINKILPLTVLASSLILAGCDRPTQYESTYETDMNNKYTWNGKGPGMDFGELVGSQELVSHKIKTINFPIIPNLESIIANKIDLNTLSDEQREMISTSNFDQFVQSIKDEELKEQLILSIETDQSIITAAGDGYKSTNVADKELEGSKEILIQEAIIGYNIKPDADSVKRYYIDHKTEDRYLLPKNLDGLLRTFLQTKDKDYIEKHQDKIGIEALNYIKNFQVGGTPEYNDGQFMQFKGGYTIEDEWGIEITDITPRRIRQPSYVLSAIPEGQKIIKKGQSELDSSEAIATERRAKLRTLMRIADEVGDNPSAANYLNGQTIAELVQDLGHQNIRGLKITQGLSGDNQKIQYSAGENMK